MVSSVSFFIIIIPREPSRLLVLVAQLNQRTDMFRQQQQQQQTNGLTTIVWPGIFLLKFMVM